MFQSEDKNEMVLLISDKDDQGGQNDTGQSEEEEEVYKSFNQSKGRLLLQVCLLITFTLSIFFVYCILIPLLNKPQFNQLTNNTYIVLSSDLNLYYLAHVPLIIQYWKNKGVGAVLLITLTEKETVDQNPAVEKILDYSKKLGAHIEYLHNKTILAGQFAQTARSFAAGTEFSFSLPEDAVFITTDIDFYPTDISHHIPDRSKGKEMMFYDYNCCGSVEWKGLRYQMYIMITIGMTLKRWREVIELPTNNSIDSDFIDRTVNATFDNSIKDHSMFWYWFLDQRFFGFKMNNWVAPSIDNFEKIADKFGHAKTLPRLNKYEFPAEEEINKMNVFEKYESFHIAPGIVFESNWKKNLPLYRQFYPADQLAELTKYRNEVVAVTNLTEVSERFYHPDQNGKKWKKQYGKDWKGVHQQNWSIKNWKNLEK